MSTPENSSDEITTVVKGHFYDGQSSLKNDGTVSVDENGGLKSSNHELDPISFNDVTVSSRVGNSARYLTFADGMRFETLDNDTVDELCRRWQGASHGLADRLEKSIPLVLIAVVVVGLGSFAFLRYGIPALSKPIASIVPIALDQRLGRETQKLMDEQFLEPSELSEDRKAELQKLFVSLKPATKNTEYQLLFRKVGGMPNAFALPNGTVVMTDALVKLADNNDMLAGIFLHEIGHVEERHSIQMLVRQAGLSVVILMVTGDVDAAGAILLLPTLLAQAHYSQGLEIDADSYALKEMLDRNINTKAFADIMVKLENYTEEKEQTSDPHSDGQEEKAAKSASAKVFDYISSHPATKERIERFRRAQD